MSYLLFQRLSVKQSLLALLAGSMFITAPLLTINAPAHSGILSTIEERTEDSIAETKIKVDINQDDLLDNTDIDVDVDDGIAILEGAVNSNAQARRAVGIAKRTKHVTRVINHISVTGAREQYQEDHDNIFDRIGHGLDDGQLANRIRLKIRTEGLSDGGDIDVKVNDNVAILTGHVEKQADARGAVGVAQSFKGVRRVISKIKVRPQYD